jgi:hypothetical protein
MTPKLPPPDPNESLTDPVAGKRLPAPTALFLAPPSPEVDRVAERVLDLRPGLLIVLARA